jgi:hypothetical protein
MGFRGRQNSSDVLMVVYGKDRGTFDIMTRLAGIRSIIMDVAVILPYFVSL